MKTLKHLTRETETHTMSHTQFKDSYGDVITEPRRFRSNTVAAAESAFTAVTQAFRASKN